MSRFIEKIILVLRYIDAYSKCYQLGNLRRLKLRKVNVLRYLLHEIKYFKSNQFDLVLDVGSNKGEFASIYLELYPKAAVKCFEPIPALAQDLRHKFELDPQVEIYECALSDVSGNAELHITRNIASSSLLKPNASNILSENGADVIETIKVKKQTLDDILQVSEIQHRKILCKVDVQGAELSMLKGASKTLAYIDTIILECGFSPLYFQEAGFNKIYQFLQSHDFDIIGVLKQSGKLENGFSRNLDIVFQKKNC